jgi:lipopolysaccharide export system protein LptC
MMDRFALWLPIAVLVLLALLSFWIEQSVKEAGSPNGVNQKEPDSIVENFLAVSTDVAGVPRYRLSADKLTHFSGSKLTLLDNPRLTHLHEEQGEMEISSEKASVSPEGDKVIFTGEVNLLRPAYDGRKEMSMQTSYLEVLTEKSEALTEEPVVIKQPGMQIAANGLHLFANTRILKLKGRVKAQYQNANPA